MNDDTHVLKRWFEEVWNQGRESAIDELAAPDVVAHDLTDSKGRRISGREIFHEFWRGFRSAFPDVRIEVADAIREGDREFVRCVCEGTHRGAGIGIAATGKPVRFTGMVFARVRDGQLVEVWENWNFLSLYQQLDVAPTSFA